MKLHVELVPAMLVVGTLSKCGSTTEPQVIPDLRHDQNPESSQCAQYSTSLARFLAHYCLNKQQVATMPPMTTLSGSWAPKAKTMFCGAILG